MCGFECLLRVHQLLVAKVDDARHSDCMYSEPQKVGT